MYFQSFQGKVVNVVVEKPYQQLQFFLIKLELEIYSAKYFRKQFPKLCQKHQLFVISQNWQVDHRDMTTNKIE